APESTAYVAPLSLRIRSRLDIGALRSALRQLLARHQPLRTTFATRDGEPVAVVQNGSEALLEQVDASTWSDAEVNSELVARAEQPFDLERGPLLRVLVLTRSPQDHHLLMTAHHIVIDLWSMVVMMDELGRLYEGEARGEPAQLVAPLGDFG